MTDVRKFVKVFLASPGDLSDERKTAKSVVEEFNDLLAEEFGYQVELVGWEDTVSVFGRPQATINRELERCELFVGMMWKHWGTPPDVDGPYTSGFEEEFRTAVDRRLRQGRPEISLLFKEIEPAFLRDPGDGLKKVLAFKTRLVEEKTILFEQFTDTRDFEKKFRRCITTYICNLRAREEYEVSTQNQSPTTGLDSRKPVEQASETENPLSAKGAQFLHQFVSKTERGDALSALDIARFRLLGSIVGAHGNDENVIGVHDANLLFAQGGSLEFGESELIGLLATGLDHYANENVPTWRWLAKLDGFKLSIIAWNSLGSERGGERRVGALAAMKLISEPLPSDPDLDRSAFLDAWFSIDAPKSVKVAALGYLGDCGIGADTGIIRQEFNRGDSQTAIAAAQAIIRINLRDSREKALLALCELQPSSIGEELLTELFGNQVGLSTESLLLGVTHTNAEVRRWIVAILRGRGALGHEAAQQLLADSSAAVRYEALMSLVDTGRVFSDEEAKRILIKPVRGGLMALTLSDKLGEECWTKFRRHRLRSLNDTDLEKVSAEESIFERDATCILAERHFGRLGNMLRSAVDDQFKADFAHALKEMGEKYGAQEDLIEKTRSLEDFVCERHTRNALEVICGKSDPRDLALVRKTLKAGFVDYSPAYVEYLRKFGEWEDIALIIESVERSSAGSSGLLLAPVDGTRYRAAARALHALGRTRIRELLGTQMPGRLLSHVIVQTPERIFRDISDSAIELLLRSEVDSVRKAVALKCIRVLPKTRTSRLLSIYVSGDQFRYYNVIHWLDFGVSAPKERVMRATEKVLKEGWQI